MECFSNSYNELESCNNCDVKNSCFRAFNKKKTKLRKEKIRKSNQLTKQLTREEKLIISAKPHLAFYDPSKPGTTKYYNPIRRKQYYHKTGK